MMAVTWKFVWRHYDLSTAFVTHLYWLIHQETLFVLYFLFYKEIFISISWRSNCCVGQLVEQEEEICKSIALNPRYIASIVQLFSAFSLSSSFIVARFSMLSAQAHLRTSVFVMKTLQFTFRIVWTEVFSF